MKCASMLIAMLSLITMGPEDVLGGSIQGQAKGLRNDNIGGVTVRLFTAQGAFFGEFAFANGNYTIPLDRFPENNQAVIAEFSSPGRRTVSLTVSTARDNRVDVAMPVDTRPSYTCYRYPVKCYQNKPYIHSRWGWRR